MLRMRLALVGDIHLHRFVAPPWRMLGKRIVGHLNPVLNRGRRFRDRRLPAVLERVETLAPDLVLFSGDFTTTALPGELRAAANLVRPLAERRPVVAVPGNHDRYTFGSARSEAFHRAFRGLAPERYPDLKPLGGRWHLLSLDSAVPRMVSSRGRLGARQLAATAEALGALGRGDGLVVLCHYPFHQPPARRLRPGHGLQEAPQLADLLRPLAGPVLFAHGHVHEPWAYAPPALPGLIDLNAGSPTLEDPAHPYGQGFWLIELPDASGAPVRLVHQHPRAEGWCEREVTPGPGPVAYPHPFLEGEEGAPRG